MIHRRSLVIVALLFGLNATLATGADPSAHGMVANVWLDRSTGVLTYNVEDARYPILTEGAGVDLALDLGGV